MVLYYGFKNKKSPWDLIKNPMGLKAENVGFLIKIIFYFETNSQNC